MKRTLIAVAVFIVLLLGGGATLVGGQVAAAKNSASPPGSTKDTWRNEFVQAGWNTTDAFGLHDEGWVNASKDVETGNAYLMFNHWNYRTIQCPNGNFGQVGTFTFGSAPAEVDVKTKTAHASAFIPLQTQYLNPCFDPGPPQWTPAMVITVDLTSDGNTFTSKNDTCYPTVGGTICTTIASIQTSGAGMLLEGSFFDHRVTGYYGHSRGSYEFIPYK